MTASGAGRLRDELKKLRQAEDSEPARMAELEQILASISVVQPPNESSSDISFGARVTVRDANGVEKSYHIVGIDELDLHSDAVSWISPVAKALIVTELNHRVTLPDIGAAKVVKVEYPSG